MSNFNDNPGNGQKMSSELKQSNNQKIVVLHVLGCLGMGGAEGRIMDLIRSHDDEQIEYAFLVHSKGPDHYDSEVIERGIPIYRVPAFRMYNYFSYKKSMDKFFKSHPEITIVQGNMTSTAAIYLPIAKKYGMVTIAHSRSAGVEGGIKGILTKWLTRHLPDKTDYMWACSTDAAKGTFGEKVYNEGRTQVVFDNIDVDKFKNVSGDKVRMEYHLEDNFVVGHVGSFGYPKNHEFLIDIFAEIKKLKANSKLIMVGIGANMENIKEKVQKLGLSDSCIFAGKQTEIENYFAAMDVFVFPSRYEGLPGVVLEAESSGLPILASDVITRDVDVTELIKYESLNAAPEVWAKEAVAHYEMISKKKAMGELADCNKQLKEAGFDVHLEQKKLNEQYHILAQERIV